MLFQNSMVAIVTPMHSDGSVDKNSLNDLIEWHIDSKTDGIIIVGSTGEAATLTDDEQIEVITGVVKRVNKRIPVIAGTGSCSTQHTLDLTLAAKKVGVDGCLIVTPYYNRPTQNGLYEHYKFVAEKAGLPILLYNVPGRTGCDLLPETVARLAKIPNIVGIKEATGKIERATEILDRCGNDFTVVSGDDLTSLELMFNGAHGVISVTANVAPGKMHEMCKAARNGNKTLAEKINNELLLLHKNLFLEPNPIPVKWALNEIGKIPDGIRLPLLPLDAKFHGDVREAIRVAGILN